MSAFSRSADRITWATNTGPVSLTEDSADQLLAIFQKEHDELLRRDDRLCARILRTLCLDLMDALEPVAMPILRPITTPIRQLNPALWGNTGEAA